MLSAAAAIIAALSLPMNDLDHSTIKESDFAFLTGSWEAQIWGGTFEEVWSKPAGGTITHMGRLLVEGKTSFIEFSSIERDKEGRWTLYVMLGAPSRGDKKPVPFVLEKAAKGDLTFLNPLNAFPSSIRYQGEGKAVMTATLKGTQNGNDQTDVFNFKRVG